MDDGALTIQTGDLVSFMVESTGYLGTPSLSEPVPERADPVTHLRAIPAKSGTKDIPGDFSTRCMFRITSDQGQSKAEKVKYGGIVRLVHEPTGLFVVATDHEDKYDGPHNSFFSIQLKKSLTGDESLAAQWVISSRYRLRSEGDFVHVNDFVILRSAHFKQRQMTTARVSTKFDSLVGLNSDAFNRKGLQIFRLSEALGPDNGEEHPVRGGDYITLEHQEHRGFLVCRGDDEKDLNSLVSPLGQYCVDSLVDPEHSNSVFVRSGRGQFDQSSCLNVWQILPQNVQALGKFKSGTMIRLRHVLTGMYLCMRETSDLDCTAVSIDSKFDMADRHSPSHSHHARMVVATCATLDPSTLFHIHTSGDITMNGLLAEINAGVNMVDLTDSVFFIHHASQLMLVSGHSKLHPVGLPRFNDYTADLPLRPKEFVGDFAILSETFKLHIVKKSIVEDTLFAAKFLPLAKASCSCLQLTPRMDRLYLPLYRHFNLALHTLVRWTLGRYDSDGQLVRHPRGRVFSASKSTTDVHEQDKDSDFSECESEADDEVSQVAEEDAIVIRTSSVAEFSPSPPARNYSHVSVPDDLAAALEVLGGGGGGDDSPHRPATAPPRISSLSPWIGRGSCPFTRAAIPAPILSERVEDVLAQVSVNELRQNILRDSGLLELLQNYVNIVFGMLKVQTKMMNQKQPSVVRRGAKPPMSPAEREAIYLVPQIVSGCCILCYDVLNLCLINNPRTAMRLLGVKGTLLSMMSHEFLGWKPPIEQLLLSEQLAHRSKMFDAGGFSRVRLNEILSPEDVADIVKQMYAFHASRNNADINLLRLLVTMACPGKRPNRYIQDQILEDLFIKSKVILRTRIADQEKQLSQDGAEIRHSLLFSTRRMNNSNTWEVLFSADFRFESEVHSPKNLKDKLVAEHQCLRNLFNSCCSNDIGVLGVRDSELLVEKLGFAGADLVVQSRSLNKCNFDKFTDWWWANRSFYFPSLTSALNSLTAADARSILSGNVVEFVPPAEPVPEYDYDVFAGGADEEEPFAASNPMNASSGNQNGRSSFVGGLSKNLADRRKSVGAFISKSLEWMPKAPDVSSKMPSLNLPSVPDLNMPTLPSMSAIPFRAMEKQDSREVKEEFEPADKIRRKITSRVPGFDFLSDSGAGAAHATNFTDLFGQSTDHVSALDRDVSSFDPVIVSGGDVDIEDHTRNEDAEKYSGLFITLSKSFARANQELQAKKKTNSENWQVLTDVLAEEGDSRVWFREACNLLAELCRGKNSFSQDCVSMLLPADLIIGVLLRTGIKGSMQDKIIGCALLTSVYIRHDLVFASTATVASEDCPVAVREVDVAIETSAGKLFSAMNRRTFKSASEHEGGTMRRMLWTYLRDEIKMMDFSFTTKEVSEFNVALLKLANELLQLGFFDEADKFLENKRLAQELLKQNEVSTATKNRCFGIRRSIEDEETAFDTIALENILIDKVISTLKELRTNFKAMQNYVVNEIQFSAARGILSNDEAGKAAKKISMKKGPNLGLNSSKYVGLYLNSQYSESFRIQATQEVIAILWSIFESRQLRRIRNIVGILRQPSLVFDKSILTDEDTATQDLENLTFSKAVHKDIMDQFYEPREFSLTYFRALMAATLFHHNLLRGNTYNLIYRSLSPEIDIVNIIKNMRIVPNVEEAAAARFLSVFYGTLEKFWKRLLESPDQPSKYVINTMKFCFDAMTSVCFRKFKEVGHDDTNRLQRGKARRGLSKRNAAISASSPNVSRPSSLSSTLSLPALNASLRVSIGRGGIEMKRFSRKELDLDIILLLTSRAKRSTAHPALPWIYHVVKPTVVKLLSIAKRILRVHSTADGRMDTSLPWTALNLAEQFFVNRFFSFLATISFDSPVMCLEFFADLCPVLKRYWWVPECHGAADLMAILCKFMDLNELLDRHDVNTIFGYIVDLEEYESPRKKAACETVISILSNPTKGNFVQSVTKRVRSDIVENGSIRSYVHVDGDRASDFDLDLHMLVLKIIVATLRIRTDHQFVDAVKTLLTAQFCKDMLDSNTPLQNRASFLEIVFLIYDHDEVPGDDYVHGDMVLFDELESLCSPEEHASRLEDLQHSLTQYFADGIIKLLLRRCLAVNGVKMHDIKDVITRSTVFVKKEIVTPSKHDLLTVAKMNNYGMREVSDLGEPLNPADLMVGSLSQPVFFETVTALYAHLSACENSLLGALVLDPRNSERVLSLIAAVQIIQRRMYPTEESVLPEEKPCWNLINEMLPKAIMIKLEREQKNHIENFLRTEGSDAYMTGIRQLLLPPEPDENMYLTNKTAFKDFIDFSPVLPAETLKKSALYEVLQSVLGSSLRFISIGGIGFEKSGNHTKELKRMSDFDVWLEGGGRYIRALGEFLGKEAPASVSTYTLIHILCSLLENDIETLREQKKNLKRMMERVATETKRLRDVQNALSSFGISEMVIRIVQRCENATVHDPIMSELGPLALKLGSCLLASGNPRVQDDFISLDDKLNYSGALRHLFRKCSMKLTKFLKKKLDGPYPTYIFRTISEVFKFCGMLCSGHNERGRVFMRIQGGRHTLNLNLVSDITSTLNVVLQVVINQMKYISNDTFYEQLAPFVWRPMYDQKRRLIAWHQAADMNFLLMSQVSLTLVDGFIALKFICQDQDLENQLSATPALTLCPALLEFTGSMELRVNSKNNGGKGSNIFWNCSDPYEFYSTYKSESKKANIFADDKQAPYIRRCKKQWAEIQSYKNKFSRNKKTSVDLLGISLDLFKELFADAEQACLRMMNAMLDGDSETVVDALSESLDEGILMQNMDNLFQMSLKAPKEKQTVLKDNISFYLSLLSTLSSFVDKPSAILDKYIDQWKLDCIKAGHGINNFFAAVEITSPSGILQKVFFPIPDFVLQYWTYPRVQQAKERALWSVSRESPEDKLADFYLKMQGIIVVMRRQQVLARVFPPFRWMRYLLSDKSFFSYLPLVGMREFILIITVMLNVYHAYINFRDTYPWYKNSESDWAKDFFEWDERGFCFFIVGCIHAAFCGLLAFNNFINSPDSDELEPIDLPYRDKIAAIDAVGSGLETIRNCTVMLLSAWWPICLTGFSVLALLRNPFWYALVLLDVVPQISLMSFLVEAITRNAKKILYTLLLAAIFLYLFAVANVLFIPNQLHLDFGLTNPPEWLGVDNISPYTGREAISTTYGYILSLIMGSVYNWVFVILINLVLQAIISGLIIDTFGEMRAENEEIENDIRAGCFICSIDKDEFEQAGVSFEEHINDEHNMWKYIWFQIYLELKDPLSFSAPEYSAFKQLGNKQDFVHLGPVKKSLSIERRAGQVKEQFTNKVIFQGIKRSQDQQLKLMEEVLHLRQRDVDHTKTIKLHGKILESIKRSLENTSAAAGDTDIYLRDLQEQLSTSTADIQKSVDASMANLLAAITKRQSETTAAEERKIGAGP